MADRSPVARLMLGASALTTLGAIPPFLLGAQAVLIMRDLGFGAARLGIAVSTFFAVAAVATILASGLLERWGAGRMLLAAGVLVASGGLGLALLVQDWWALVVAMAVLGAGNATCQGASNRTVATLLPASRRGLGFGLKQSAVPVAIMLGGLAVPTTTTLFGWRSTFGVAGAVGVLVALAGVVVLGRERTARGAPPGTAQPRAAETGGTRSAGSSAVGPRDLPPRGPLLLCGVATTFASAAANFLGSYLASWAHEVGLTISQAGLLMAAGSGASVLSRVLLGFQADRRYGGNLAVVASLTLVGAVCLAALGAVPREWAVVLFGFLAFALGWSWPGLYLYAVARLGRDTPTRASSVVQAGAFVGGALGPVGFGTVVESLGFQGAWLAGAASFTVAGILTLLARRGFRRDLFTRPPAEPFGFGGGRRSPRFTTQPPSFDTRS
ncbi:MAG TPA: MFS transporter [Ornithinicoccus sp.]|jgi:MFS family permease|nr:MFS transporter [Ornithinicoccus sp.]